MNFCFKTAQHSKLQYPYFLLKYIYMLQAITVHSVIA